MTKFLNEDIEKIYNRHYNPDYKDVVVAVDVYTMCNTIYELGMKHAKQDYREGYVRGHIAGGCEAIGIGQEQGYEHGNLEGYAEGYSNGHQEGRDSGYEIGHNDGYEEGHQDGEAEGYNKGHTDGYEDGYMNGYTDGNN